ncbi:MAG: hypothetical protein ACLR0U_00510 [Enterocloster clostridioformis]
MTGIQIFPWVPFWRPLSQAVIFCVQKLRAAIELLDQLYQYGEAGNTRINELGQETFEEDVPSLEEFDSH